jgi:hypothetical protein
MVCENIFKNIRLNQILGFNLPITGMKIIYKSLFLGDSAKYRREITSNLYE